MRKHDELIALFRGLADLLEDEAGRNPAFAERTAALMAGLPERNPRTTKPKATQAVPTETLPDIHAEMAARGEVEFRLWLKGQTVPVLRALIGQQDLDPTRKTSRWRGADKLADFVADGLAARRARGGGFLTGGV